MSTQEWNLQIMNFPSKRLWGTTRVDQILYGFHVKVWNESFKEFIDGYGNKMLDKISSSLYFEHIRFNLIDPSDMTARNLESQTNLSVIHNCWCFIKWEALGFNHTPTQPSQNGQFFRSHAAYFRILPLSELSRLV